MVRGKTRGGGGERPPQNTSCCFVRRRYCECERGGYHCIRKAVPKRPLHKSGIPPTSNDRFTALSTAIQQGGHRPLSLPKVLSQQQFINRSSTNIGGFVERTKKTDLSAFGVYFVVFFFAHKKKRWLPSQTWLLETAVRATRHARHA